MRERNNEIHWYCTIAEKEKEEETRLSATIFFMIHQMRYRHELIIEMRTQTKNEQTIN